MRMLIVTAASMALASGASEADMDKWMKECGKAMGALRKGMEAKSAPDVAAAAKSMHAIFPNVEGFFKEKGKSDATQWSVESAAAAKELHEAAAGGDLAKAGAAMKTLGSKCQGCHNAYREKLPDGSYKLKL
jgi:cytochrome c556